MRRTMNHETVESVLDVLELEPLTESPQLGATDGATDDPPSHISGFPICRRQQRNSGESPAQSGHGGAFPDSIHDLTVWDRR